MSYIPPVQSFLAVSNESVYSAERAAASGNNMVLSDQGANSTYTFQTLRAGTPTANITLTATSSAAHYCDATGGAIAVTLPDAGTSLDKVFIIKKVDSSGNAVTVTRVGSDTFDGATSYVLSAQYDWVMIQSDGTATWRVIGKTVPAASAPSDAQYLTLATNGTLSQERVFTPGNNVFGTDGGAGAAYTVQVGPRSNNTGSTVNLTAGSNTVQTCDCTSNAITINLPAASGATDKLFRIKKTDSSANAVTIDGNASETIDGALTFTIPIQYMSVDIICNGSNWFIL